MVPAKNPKEFQYKDHMVESLTFGEISSYQGFVCCEMYPISHVKVAAGSQTVVIHRLGQAWIVIFTEGPDWAISK
jgi:hypothetical protein